MALYSINKTKNYYEELMDSIKENSSFEKTLYLDLGVKVIRIICYSKSFISHIEKQLTFTLQETSSSYDSTIIVWQEHNIVQLYNNKELLTPENENNIHNLRCIAVSGNTITLYSAENETYFYGVKNLEPEEFIKEGHIFVKIFNRILKTENSNLVHGACIGLNNKGILFCARGQRGKSTLSILSMLEGFQYVSDDYLTLEKIGKHLYAYPIYSIITLSPRMYNELYDKLEGTRFISNNARKDKYVINIANFHNRFQNKYPIELCMSLEFSQDENPKITECSDAEKGNAITQLVHSTTLQMHDMGDAITVKKIIDMVKNFKFYKLYLCNNISKNTEFLQQFMKERENAKL
ncbi:hypothetical protein II906_07700 [bacterium]|nr:hypothetical protein [bacterium]